MRWRRRRWVGADAGTTPPVEIRAASARTAASSREQTSKRRHRFGGVLTWLMLTWGSAVGTTGACSSGAFGQDVCRSIESKRCEVLAGCDGFDLDEASEVTACQLFYRDQCDFGLAADVAFEPDGPQLDRCLAALDAAAGCKGAGDDEALATCAGAPALDASYAPAAGTDGRLDVSVASACQVLNFPSYLIECRFLQATPVDDAGDDGGSDAEGGSDQGGGGGEGGSR